MEQIVAAGSLGHVSKGHTVCPALQVTVPGGLSEEQAGVNYAQKRYQGGCEPKLTMDFKEPKWHMFRTELWKEKHTTYLLFYGFDHESFAAHVGKFKAETGNSLCFGQLFAQQNQ